MAPFAATLFSLLRYMLLLYVRRFTPCARARRLRHTTLVTVLRSRHAADAMSHHYAAC